MFFLRANLLKGGSIVKNSSLLGVPFHVSFPSRRCTMVRKIGLCLLAVALLFCVNGVHKAAELSSANVTQVVFKGGATYKDQVPDSFGLIADAITKNHPSATFKIEGQRLLVGVKANGILTVTWRSDCPVNSQFGVESENPVLAKAVLKQTLVAWTQARHPHLKGDVERYNETATTAEVILKPQKK